MQLLVVSPEDEYENEADLIARLLHSGLDRYHLRKPNWSASDCADLLTAVPADLHVCVSIHQHHVLAQSFEVGLHFKDDAAAAEALADSVRREATPLRSRSLHRLNDLAMNLSDVDYGFLSPVFQSISKRGYVPRWSDVELRAALSQDLPAKLYALGGVTPSTLRQARAFGFEGVVLYGSIWQSDDPLAAFASLRKEAA
jgi:thiamine-phosphate pyrophosphorylase